MSGRITTHSNSPLRTLNKVLQIGNVKINTPVLLAPMAGVTDYAFRILCRNQGAGMVYSEFVSADGIIRENAKTLKLIRFSDGERPIGIQIFGSDPEVMSKAARYVVTTFKPDILDINYGCPVPKITKRGAGAAALKDLSLLDDITSAVVEAAGETPVTVKMRAGWDRDSIVVPDVGPRLAQLGVKAITLHPRTSKQGYSGKADWSLIRKLVQSLNRCPAATQGINNKRKLKLAATVEIIGLHNKRRLKPAATVIDTNSSIPVIGNGDIRKPEDVLRMFDETGCDGVMAGRAALGNPWFFYQTAALLRGESIPDTPSLTERIEMCNQHFDLLIRDRGERAGTNLMRKHFGWYIKGFQGAQKIRQRLITAPGSKEMKEGLQMIGPSTPPAGGYDG